jgi:hypothetical protein
VWSYPSHSERIKEEYNMDRGLELLALVEREAAEEINPILEQVGIPKDVYWSVSETMRDIIYPQILNANEAIINNDMSCFEALTPQVPSQILLIGRYAEQYITAIHFPFYEEIEGKIDARVRVFLESLRQQLSTHCGIICPCASKGEMCCGRKGQLQRLYNRLPKEDKEHFVEPNCDRVR